MFPWSRTEKSLAWLGLIFTIHISAVSIGSEHSIAKGFLTAAENSWSRARLPTKLFNILRWLLHLAVRLEMLQGVIQMSLEALPGGGGVMPRD